jgi:hypothetical protein
MFGNYSFAYRKRRLEEEYFLRRERELIMSMRRRVKAEDERRQLAEALGVQDEEVLRDLQNLGYTCESVSLLHLIPLIQVAWAEGYISIPKRRLILEIARSHGIEPGSSADQKLSEWLNHQPSEEFFETTLRAIALLLQALPQEQREAGRRDLISSCTDVAAVLGGIMGLGNKICGEEQLLLNHITAELYCSH